VSDRTTIDATQTGGPVEGGGAARAYLVVREGTSTQVIDVDEGADILFGRALEATVHVGDAKASREHARVQRRDGVLTLVDLGSRNGTRVDDETVRGASRRLRSGAVIRIGACEIVVAETAGVSAAANRLEAEVARLVAQHGRAAIVRLSVRAGDRAALGPLVAGAALVEAQPDGDLACLYEEPRAAEEAVAAIRRALPHVAASIARAPEQGANATALWRRHSMVAAAPTVPAPPGVVVGDPAMVRVFELVRKVAVAPTTVLILGETGVGKEVIAEQIHRHSPRASGPFMRLNCGSLPETLLESELFGHEKGAFTGADRRKIGYVEAAEGGTLFLDEIGELALPMQTRLLRVLEDRKLMRVGAREELAVDIRVVAATNRNLEEEVKAGRFRGDLYFRLSAFVLRVPPLRERPGEIELLAALFARQLAKRMNVAPPTVSEAAMQVLRRHRWPGNVRELRNAIEHAVVLAEEGVIERAHLPESVREPAVATPAPGGAMREQIAELERQSIVDALDAEGGNQTRAAKRLGISRRALLYKLEKYGL